MVGYASCGGETTIKCVVKVKHPFTFQMSPCKQVTIMSVCDTCTVVVFNLAVIVQLQCLSETSLFVGRLSRDSMFRSCSGHVHGDRHDSVL